MLRSIMNQFNITQSVAEPELEDIDNKTSLRMQLLRKHSNRSPNIGLEAEIIRFSNIHTHEEDVLKFWHEEEKHFPLMAAVAKVLLCKPATSAASESAFSVAGALLSKRRASIDPFRARKILFIHDNYEMLQMKTDACS